VRVALPIVKPYFYKVNYFRKAPRKPLFIISSLLVSLGMGLLGLAGK